MIGNLPRCREAGAAMTDDKQVLDLEEPLDLNTMFLDTACVKANIHFPVDWVLLRDGVKSLMQSVELIRTHGLKSLAFARDPMCSTLLWLNVSTEGIVEFNLREYVK
jgi:hypothetical protein